MQEKAEKAFEYFTQAFNSIKSGNFFDEQTNNAFEMMLKSLWNTDKKSEIKKELLTHLASLYERAKSLETPAPFLYILMSLKDPEILQKFEGLVIGNFIADKGTEESVFNLGNLINTLTDKNVPVGGIVKTMVRSIQEDFNQQFTLALSHIISIQHPEFVGVFVKRFLEFNDVSWLKHYIRSTGKRALLEAIKLADDPEKLRKILGESVAKN